MEITHGRHPYPISDICQSIMRLGLKALLTQTERMVIAENLIKARKAKKFTQAKLAERAGVPQSLISDLERGNRKSTDSLPAIAAALGIEPGDLDPRFKRPEMPTINVENGPLASLIQVLCFSILRLRAVNNPEIDPAKDSLELSQLLLAATKQPPDAIVGVDPDSAIRLRLADLIEKYGSPKH